MNSCNTNRTKEEALTLASEIASQVTETTPDADIALFVPYVFIETTMDAVGGKIEIGAEVSRDQITIPVESKVCKMQ